MHHLIMIETSMSREELLEEMENLYRSSFAIGQVQYVAALDTVGCSEANIKVE